MKKHSNVERITYIGLMTALALVFSYVETLIPINFGIPGVKLGIANVVSVTALYLFGFPIAIAVQLLRIILSGFMFTGLYSLLYSLSGGVISVIIMYLAKRTNKASTYMVSIIGGVTHNIGQLLVAIFVVNQIKLSYYGPILIISGIITGLLIGIVCVPVIKSIETYVR